MRIAHITLDGYYNHGNVLQRYAVCKKLGAYADVVDSIWVSPKESIHDHIGEMFPWCSGLGIGFKDYIKYLLNYRNFRYNLLHGGCVNSVIRDALIKSFCDRYINVLYNNSLNSIANKYDFFVVGSDQVWNPCFFDCNTLEKYLLKFVPKGKRIAFSASIAVENIPEDKLNCFKYGIRDINYISVREESGAEIIKRITGRSDVSVLLDPTLLLSAGEWEKIARKPSWLNADDNYLITYFLGECHLRRDLENMAIKHGWKVFHLLGENNIFDLPVSPEEWLYLIKNAAMVYTDSFHGTVFSIYFRVPFVVLDRNSNEDGSSMGSRIDTLLAKFQLKACRGTQNNGYLLNERVMPDYSKVDCILEMEREKADAFLRRALSL